jgi:single-stranded DNA-specific DHH superfamily exonuclease
MALTEEQIKEIRSELENSFRPLFFFDDDPDGLCSFLLMYRKVNEGKGIVVKTAPEMDEKFLKHVEEYNPDKIFILDKPLVSQDFIDGAKIKVIWIDHHEPVDRKNVKYYNPRINDDKDNRPTSFWCYKIAEGDLWIAMIGILGDWFLPVFSDEFTKLYPHLLPEHIKKPENALFETELGKLIRIFSFILKGKTQDVMKCVKILTRIKGPDEILLQTTSQGKFIYKKYETINKQYEEVLKDVKVTDDKIILYTYKDDKMSFTADLSNELLYKYPDRIIIVGREKSGEVKCSLRSTNVKLPILIQTALKDVEGYGGGHEYASGACIKKSDFDRFLENIRKQIE